MDVDIIRVRKMADLVDLKMKDSEKMKKWKNGIDKKGQRWYNVRVASEGCRSVTRG